MKKEKDASNESSRILTVLSDQSHGVMKQSLLSWLDEEINNSQRQCNKYVLLLSSLSATVLASFVIPPLGYNFGGIVAKDSSSGLRNALGLYFAISSTLVLGALGFLVTTKTMSKLFLKKNALLSPLIQKVNSCESACKVGLGLFSFISAIPDAYLSYIETVNFLHAGAFATVVGSLLTVSAKNYFSLNEIGFILRQNSIGNTVRYLCSSTLSYNDKARRLDLCERIEYNRLQLFVDNKAIYNHFEMEWLTEGNRISPDRVFSFFLKPYAASASSSNNQSLFKGCVFIVAALIGFLSSYVYFPLASRGAKSFFLFIGINDTMTKAPSFAFGLGAMLCRGSLNSYTSYNVFLSAWSGSRAFRFFYEEESEPDVSVCSTADAAIPFNAFEAKMEAAVSASDNPIDRNGLLTHQRIIKNGVALPVDSTTMKRQSPLLSVNGFFKVLNFLLAISSAGPRVGVAYDYVDNKTVMGWVIIIASGVGALTTGWWALNKVYNSTINRSKHDKLVDRYSSFGQIIKLTVPNLNDDAVITLENL